MKVEHVVTKRVQSGKRRLFFRCHNNGQMPFGGKIEIELAVFGKTISKINAYNEAIAPGFYSNFYADVPTVIAEMWSSFRWSWGSNSGKGDKSKKFEKVY